MYEAGPKHNYDVERVEAYMLKAKRILNDPEKGRLYSQDFLDARKRLWESCQAVGDDPRNYAMYHIMFGTPETLAERESKGGILHEDLSGGETVASFIDSFENKG